MMSVEEKLQELIKENERLKKDNDAMKKVIIQMRGTLNRMITSYVTGSSRKS